MGAWLRKTQRLGTAVGGRWPAAHWLGTDQPLATLLGGGAEKPRPRFGTSTRVITKSFASMWEKSTSKNKRLFTPDPRKPRGAKNFLTPSALTLTVMVWMITPTQNAGGCH